MPKIAFQQNKKRLQFKKLELILQELALLDNTAINFRCYKNKLPSYA